ncbi:MAG TPA: hypothetical protein DD429_10945 [Clostridiaceae bacterium]|nr:hypothetical protein [Clostridiaceae bacterium]
MKKIGAVLLFISVMFVVCSCDYMELSFNRGKNPFADQLINASRIIFTNCKDNALKFTVSDPKVIKQIVDITSKSREVEGLAPDVKPDYKIEFYLPNGRVISFDYWMGAAENNKEINLKEEKGKYYMVQGSLDTYIINSIKMYERPEKFDKLYSACLSESISLLKKDEDGSTTVGVDINSDRKMRKYTMSYELRKILNGIKAEGFDVVPYSEGGEYSYIVSFITNMYNPTKAKITVEAVRVSDKTKKTFVFEPKLTGSTWTTNRVIESEKE